MLMMPAASTLGTCRDLLHRNSEVCELRTEYLLHLLTAGAPSLRSVLTMCLGAPGRISSEVKPVSVLGEMVGTDLGGLFIGSYTYTPVVLEGYRVSRACDPLDIR